MFFIQKVMKFKRKNKDAEQRGCERKLPIPSNVELGMKRRKRGLESAGAEIRGHYNILDRERVRD